MRVIFEWDESKATANESKHGISFDEAATVFEDPLSLTIRDVEHADEEDRYVDLDISRTGRLLVVVYTERDDHVRIISCREATKAERRAYEQ